MIKSLTCAATVADALQGSIKDGTYRKILDIWHCRTVWHLPNAVSNILINGEPRR
jgi:hypothetical protein